MIGLTTSCLALNTSLRIQNLHFTSAPWSHTEKFNNFKYTIFMKHAKFIERARMPNTLARKARQTREHVKHAST